MYLESVLKDEYSARLWSEQTKPLTEVKQLCKSTNSAEKGVYFLPFSITEDTL